MEKAERNHRGFLAFALFIVLCPGLVIIIAASAGEKEFPMADGHLIRVAADTARGFHYPYFLFIPDRIGRHSPQVLVVQPNNTGTCSDDFQIHESEAKSVATRRFYLGNYVARELSIPLLVPVFPRAKKNWLMYTHALDRETMQADQDLKRIDLQLLAMIADSKQKLFSRGISIQDRFFMTGFSASATFVNRFSLIHPDNVRALACGGLNGILMLPLKSHQGQTLPYPLGVADFETLFNKSFDLKHFSQVPQFIFMGTLDTNDATRYADAYNREESALIFRVLGEEMMPNRWQRCLEIYIEKGVQLNGRTFSKLGHEKTEDIKKEICAFFKKHIHSLPLDSDIAESKWNLYLSAMLLLQ